MRGTRGILRSGLSAGTDGCRCVAARVFVGLVAVDGKDVGVRYAGVPRWEQSLRWLFACVGGCMPAVNPPASR